MKGILAVALIATLILSASFLAFPSSSASNASVPIVPSSMAPTLLWNFTVGGSVFTPAIENNVVYAGSGSDIYALNASDGSQLWKNSIGQFNSGPVVVDDVVYVGGFDYVLALNAKTGAELWENQVYGYGTYDSAPVVAGSAVYVAAQVGGISALNAKTGKTLWSYSPEYQNYLGTFSSPVVVNGMVYFGASRGVYALEADSGSLLWNNTIGYFVASPIVADGVIYIGSLGANFYALNASNGNELWNYSASASISSTPDVANGIVYVSSQDGNLYALNATNGDKLWNYTVVPSTYAGYSLSPIVAGNTVYTGSGNGEVYAFDAVSGSKLWNYTVGNASLSGPIIDNSVLFIGSADGNVYVLRVSTASSPSAKSFNALLIVIVGVFAALIVATVIALIFKKDRKSSLSTLATSKFA